MFLRFGAWSEGSSVVEIASRPRLDARQVLPVFRRDGELFGGVLERARPARGVRSAPLVGDEAIGIDLSGVDETADVLAYGRAVFTAHTGVRANASATVIPLPSHARSIGYLTELALPLLLPIVDPGVADLPVTWDGETHVVRFRPVAEHLARLTTRPHAEDLELLLRAAAPANTSARVSGGGPIPARLQAHVRTADDLARALREPLAPTSATRRDVDPGDLRFLRLTTTTHAGRAIEIVTPGSGISLAIMAFFRSENRRVFALYVEPRAGVRERRHLAPLFDLPLSDPYANATASYVAEDPTVGVLADAVQTALATAWGVPITIVQASLDGSGGEPAPGTSSEVRHRAIVEIEPPAALPAAVWLVAEDELARAVSLGLVRDPIVPLTLLALGIDPYAAVRAAPVQPRRAFVDGMTEGSRVLSRLRAYSSIEAEQMRAPTYARIMTLLQHDFGVRVTYPKTEADRSFFKAAFRVFMATPRDDGRALAGLHWSHDAFHFALGNFTLPGIDGFDDWYASGGPAPAPPPIATDEPFAHEPLKTYGAALKGAENEATFFSFFTLYAEVPSLAKHVPNLTYEAALREMGITDRAEARRLFDALTDRAEMPEALSRHALFARDDVRNLFEYMQGFRDYHRKDILTAYQFASKDPYRGFFARFRLYETDLDRYLANVHGFAARLAALPPGLNPLLARTADVRVAIGLRVWDVVKGLKLLRASVQGQSDSAAQLRSYRALAEAHLGGLEALLHRLDALRSRVAHAELTAENEALFHAAETLEAEVEAARERWFFDLEKTGRLTPEVVAAERVRELPR